MHASRKYHKDYIIVTNKGQNVRLIPVSGGGGGLPDRGLERGLSADPGNIHTNMMLLVAWEDEIIYVYIPFRYLRGKTLYVNLYVRTSIEILSFWLMIYYL